MVRDILERALRLTPRATLGEQVQEVVSTRIDYRSSREEYRETSDQAAGLPFLDGA